jgi:hypothetical protein
MATKLILGFFLKSTKKMREDDMPPYGSEALFGSDEAGTASKLYRRHHLLTETRRDIRQTTTDQEQLNMWDDLMEKDPKMRKIRKESETKGLAEGLRTAVITAVRIRFPRLTELAQQKVDRISKPAKLNLLLDQITDAPDEDAARLLLDLVAA